MNFSPRETLDGGGKGEKEKGFLKGILRVIGGGREGEEQVDLNLVRMELMLLRRLMNLIRK